MNAIPLHQITGISAFNARRLPPSEEEIEELAASILAREGVTTPLLLRVENRKCVALDGGRRFLALRRLADRGEIDVNFPVPHVMFEGSDEDAAEVSLISFVQRRDLHPVDEFERFAELRDSFGLDEERIAKKTGKSLRFVKERLRLARLAPKVRAAWREGKIIAEIARAFAANESHEEQERVFAEYVEDELGNVEIDIDPDNIRSELCSEAVRATDPLAVFVGADAYAAAGGELDEQLFERDTWFLDGALLKRLAQEKLEPIGEAIVAREGWGWACYEHKDHERWTESEQPFEGDFTDAEEARLEEIDPAIWAAKEDKEQRARLEDERDEIEARGMLRAISSEERAGLGVFVHLDLRGRVAVERGLFFAETSQPVAREDGEGEESSPSPRHAQTQGARGTAPAAPATAPEPIGKSVRAVLDETVDEALGEVLARNVSLALVVAVAALGCSYGVQTLELTSFSKARSEPKSKLLQAVSNERFEKALYLCLAAHLDDAAMLPNALAELFGGLIFVGKAASFDQARVLLAVASRLGDIEGALDRALDREAFFKAEAKDVAVEAIRAMDGDAAANEARKLKKPDLVQRAALLAKDRHWLPEVLGSSIEAKPKDERSTAQAMAEAIEADEAADRKSADVESGEVRLSHAIADEADDAPMAAQDAASEDDAAGDRHTSDAGGAAGDQETAATNRGRVAQFLAKACRAEDGARIKASDLGAAYDDFAAARGWLSISPNHLSKALGENGIEKTRLKNGVHYLGLALKAPAPALDRAAE